jgi:hypothetical protein
LEDVNALMLWNMDEVMVAAPRAGLVAVSPNQTLSDGRGGKTPHVTVAPCSNPMGESTPYLLILLFPGRKRVLQDLAAMHQGSFSVVIGSKDWCASESVSGVVPVVCGMDRRVADRLWGCSRRSRLYWCWTTLRLAGT